MPNRSKEGLKQKPRGRPFPKGNVKGKHRDEILDNPGCESGIERGFIEVSPENPLPSEENKLDTSINKKILEHDENRMQEDKLQSEIVESIDFLKGNNKLSIRLTKKHNRMFRVQIFLNDGELEIRPMTYTGSNTALSFWNLLKGALKK